MKTLRLVACTIALLGIAGGCDQMFTPPVTNAEEGESVTAADSLTIARAITENTPILLSENEQQVLKKLLADTLLQRWIRDTYLSIQLHMVRALRNDSIRQQWLKEAAQWRVALRQRSKEQWSIVDYQAIRGLVGAPSWEEMQQVFRRFRERHAALWRLPERARNRVLAEYIRRIGGEIRLEVPGSLGPALQKEGMSQEGHSEGSGKAEQKHNQTSLQSLPRFITSPPCHPAERNEAWNNCERSFLIAITPTVSQHIWQLIRQCAFVGTIGCVLASLGQFIAFAGVEMYGYIYCIQNVKDQYGDFGCEFEYYYDERGGWWYEPLYPRRDPPPGWPGRGSGGGSSCVPVFVNGELMGHCCASTMLKVMECVKRYGDLN